MPYPLPIPIHPENLTVAWFADDPTVTLTPDVRRTRCDNTLLTLSDVGIQLQNVVPEYIASNQRDRRPVAKYGRFEWARQCRSRRHVGRCSHTRHTLLHGAIRCHRLSGDRTRHRPIVIAMRNVLVTHYPSASPVIPASWCVWAPQAMACPSASKSLPAPGAKTWHSPSPHSGTFIGRLEEAGDVKMTGDKVTR